MDELTRDVARAKDSIAEPWNDLRAQRLHRGVRERVAEPPRPARWRWPAVAAGVVVAVAAAVAVWRPRERAAAPAIVAPVPAPAPSAVPGPVAPVEDRPKAAEPRVVTRPSAGGRVSVVRDTADALELQVDTGRVDVELDEVADREVVVVAGDVRIEVYARSFAVERTEHRVGVWVYDGWVRVDGEREVKAGEQVWIGDAPEPAPRGRAIDAGPVPEAERTWRDHAAAGQFDDAFAALPPPGDSSLTTADAILAADTARLAGHPEAAVDYLQRALAADPDDARAPLAAFTLGRVYLYELGRPRDAAEAFARARELDPRSSVAEDALAREVEAWSRAGVDERAREAAELYLARYPDGHWRRTVKRYGGVP